MVSRIVKDGRKVVEKPVKVEKKRSKKKRPVVMMNSFSESLDKMIDEGLFNEQE